MNPFAGLLTGGGGSGRTSGGGRATGGGRISSGIGARLQQSEQQRLSAPAPQPIAAPPTPAPKPQGGLLKGVENFFTPAVNMAKGLAAGAYHIGMIVPNEARSIVGFTTGNRAAGVSGFNQAGQGLKDAASFAQFLPRAATQVGISMGNPVSTSLKEHILGADRSYTPHGDVAKFLLGDQPVQSFSNVYKTTKAATGSQAQAAGNVAVNAIGDLLAFKGGKDAAVKATAPLDNAIHNYNGLRAQAVISQLPKDQGALPAPKEQLALPARATSNPVKETPGPNGATFGSTPVSPETVAHINALDTAVSSLKNTGESVGTAQHLQDVANLRDTANNTMNSLANDRADLLKSLHQETGGVSTVKDETGTVTGRVSSNDPFYQKAYKATGKPPTNADWLTEAHRQLANGSDPEAMHYRTAANIADKAQQTYAQQLSNFKVSDIYKKNATPEQIAQLESRLQAAKDQAQREAAGQNQGPQPAATNPVVSADTLKQRLHDVQTGKSVVSKLQVLNDLIQHPDVSAADKQVYLQERDSLLPSARRPAAVAPPQPTATPRAASATIADTFNPNEPTLHEPVSQSQLHPGTRNVFAEAPAVAAGDTKAPALNRNYVSSIYHGLGAETQRLAEGMTDHDLKLIDQIESRTPQTAEEAAQRVLDVSKQADNPKQFLDVVDSMKKGKDTRYNSDIGLGRDLGYVHNHLSHVYEHDSMGPTPHGGEAPGYTKARIIATRAEAERLSKLRDENGNLLYPHLQLADVNAVEAHINAMRAAAQEHGVQAFRQGIEQAHPGVELSNKTNNGYTQLKGTNITAPRAIANIYNKRLNEPKVGQDLAVRTTEGKVVPVSDNNIAQTLQANPGGRLIDANTGQDLHNGKVARMMANVAKHPVKSYDVLNQGLKTSVLGGGTFHGLTTAGTVAGQQLVRAVAHPLSIPKQIGQNLRVIGGTFNKTAHVANMARNDALGVTDFANKTGATLGHTGDIDTGGGGIPVISHIHDAIFQRQIPEAKLMIIEQRMNQKFPGMDFKNPTPEQLAYGREVSSQANNLGGINRAVEGLTARQAKAIGRVVLAPDYTEGKFRTIANALNVTDWGPKGTIAREMVVGKSVLFALPGLVALTVAGKLNWNDPKQVAGAIVDQFVDPQIPFSGRTKGTASNPQGNQESIHLPTTFVSEIGKVIKPMIEPLSTYNGDRLSGLKSYATNRIAALPGAAARLGQNQDFYGNPLVGTDKNGNPISAGKAAANIASQLLPIPAVQGIKQATGQQSLLDTALNTAGFRVSSSTLPDAVGHTPVGLNEYYNTLHSAQKQKAAAVKQINQLATTGQPNRASRLAQEWNDSIAGHFATLRGKYPKYDPTQDSNYTSLKISPKDTSIATRARNSQKALKVLQQFR